MPKIEPLASHEWNDEQQALLTPMQQNKGVGEIAQNLFTTLARHPKLFKRWTVFANHILFKSSLCPVDRELIILRSAWLTQADYEWGQHVLIAKQAGLSNDTIRRVKNGAAANEWTSHERSLLLAVDQLHEHSTIDDECWNALSERFDEQQMLDVIVTVGNYRMLAGFMNSVDIARDDGVPGLDAP